MNDSGREYLLIMRNNNATTVLQTKYPLVQAPMSWMTDANLVATVSEAGGLGVLGLNAGQRDVTSSPEETANRMRQQIQLVKSKTTKPFGINIVAPRSGQSLSDAIFTDALLQMAYEENVTHFVVVGEAHEELFKQIKLHDGILIFRPSTPTIEQAQLAEKLGTDLLVATGSDEGGELPEQEAGTFTIVPAIVDAVNIPVLAAGGINDHRGVKAALALGAAGVYIGSRFLVTDESPMADEVKKYVIRSNFDDLVRVSAIRRSLKTPAALRYADMYRIDPQKDTETLIRQHGGMRPGMLEADFNQGVISVNIGINEINEQSSVAELVESLMTDII